MKLQKLVSTTENKQNNLLAVTTSSPVCDLTAAVVTWARSSQLTSQHGWGWGGGSHQAPALAKELLAVWWLLGARVIFLQVYGPSRLPLTPADDPTPCTHRKQQFDSLVKKLKFF